MNTTTLCGQTKSNSLYFPRFKSFAIVAIWLSLALSLALMAARFYWAISFHEPLFVITSGAEEDSLLSFWKFIQGKTIFEDPHRFPFVASAYNWLYYAFYGTLIDAVLRVLNLNVEWLPTIGRYISFVWSVTGAITAYALFRDVLARSAEEGFLVAPFAVMLFFGPLVGFWAISHNVELAATVCGLIATLTFCRLYRLFPVRALLIASLFGYLAWSFKQSHVFIPLTLGLFLLTRSDWRGLSLICIFNGLGWGVALIAGSEAYVKMLLQKGVDKSLEASRLSINLLNFAIKTTPITALVATVMLMARRPTRVISRIIDDDYALIAVCGLLVSTAISVPFSAKQGASENYYFVMSFFMVFAAFAVLPLLPRPVRFGRLAGAMLVAGWLASGVASGSVLAGINGIVSTRDWHELNAAQKACAQSVPGPVLPVAHSFLSLPWLVESEPQFNLFYNYLRERKAGYWFEGGGVGPLIERGYFGAILMPQGAEPTFDGALLTPRYEIWRANCGRLDIYVRRDK